MADLQGTFEYLGLNGFLLSTAEQTALQCSLARLSQDAGVHVKFWGKVQTLGKADYLIAQGIRVMSGEACEVDQLGERVSWYSNDGGHRWHPLHLRGVGPRYSTPKGEKRPAWMDDEEALRKESAARCDQVRGQFWGDPEFEYKVKEVMPEPEPEEAPPPPPKEPKDGDDDADDAGDDDKEDDADADAADADADAGADADADAGADADADADADKPKKKKKKFMLVVTKEATRLAHFVEQHDMHCQVIPHGMLMLTAADPSVPLSAALNKTWEGLSPATADRLESYLHLRPCISSQALPAKSNAHYNPVLDFMESIQNDIPNGVWALQYDPSLGVAVGKNLLYQGSVFYHRPGSTLFGQYYFGSGQRNLDLCFMLPEDMTGMPPRHQ